MKFLLDAHLPPVLARVMTREGYQVAHVAELEMKGAADADIWQYAQTHGYVVVSKDEDFMRYQRDADGNPRFIWVRTGNCKNRVVLKVPVPTIPLKQVASFGIGVNCKPSVLILCPNQNC